MDAWAVLGVPPGSSERAIRAAYLRRSKQLHPDLGGTDEAMRDLNAAYAEATSPSVAPPTPPSPPPAGDQFVSRPRPVAARPKVRKPRKRFYKRPVFYLLAGVFVAFVLTSGATDDPSPENRPAVYGLIGRCVNIVDRDIEAVVPCAGPHDAWVIAVVDRTEACPPLATGYVATISHHICVTTEK